MTEQLPIRFTIKHLFEEHDKASQFLITKLEAWLNFRALSANWYGDEHKIVELDFSVYPEPYFLDLSVDKLDGWQVFSDSGITGVYRHLADKPDSQIIVMISKDEINDVMKAPKTLESLLQEKLAVFMNVMAQHYSLPNFS